WVLTAGGRGSAIWQNGVKVASQSTAVTRAPASANFGVNTGNGTDHGDYQELNYLAVYNVQWDDDLCHWWSGDPYAHLYHAAAQRRYFLLGDLAGAASGQPAARRHGGIRHVPGRHGLVGVRIY